MHPAAGAIIPGQCSNSTNIQSLAFLLQLLLPALEDELAKGLKKDHREEHHNPQVYNRERPGATTNIITKNPSGQRCTHQQQQLSELALPHALIYGTTITITTKLINSSPVIATSKLHNPPPPLLILHTAFPSSPQQQPNVWYLEGGPEVHIQHLAMEVSVSGFLQGRRGLGQEAFCCARSC